MCVCVALESLRGQILTLVWLIVPANGDFISLQEELLAYLITTSGSVLALERANLINVES